MKGFLLLLSVCLLAACYKEPVDNIALPGRVIIGCDSCRVLLDSEFEQKDTTVYRRYAPVLFKYEGKTSLRVRLIPLGKQLIGLQIYNRLNLRVANWTDTLINKGDTGAFNYTFSKSD